MTTADFIISPEPGLKAQRYNNTRKTGFKEAPIPLDLSVDRKREERFLKELRQIVLTLLNGKECRVYLFGSRARGDYRRSSDADIAVEGLTEEEFSRFRLLLEEMVEGSSIPFTVDVVNLNSVSEEFKREILREGIRWK